MADYCSDGLSKSNKAITKQRSNMTLQEVLNALAEAESKLNVEDRDNMTVEMIHLVLFPDGSGAIMGTWKNKFNKDLSPEQHLLNEIFAEESEVYGFEKIEELEAWVIANHK